MRNSMYLVLSITIISIASALDCPNAIYNKVSKRESYCSTLPGDICGRKCNCVDDLYIQDGYYCDCRSCQPKTDCKTLFNDGNTVSGIYKIAPGGAFMDVYCDMNATYPAGSWQRGGWTVIQRRVDGTTNFYRSWSEYQRGFGYLQNEFWLGNDNIHALVAGGIQNELWIEMTNYAGITKYARYTSFVVGNEASKYQLTVSGYSGDAGDDLHRVHNNQNFSTYDQSNNGKGPNCAKFYLGAWWYNNCHAVNLNGKYYFGGSNPYAKGIHWHAFTGYYNSLKTVVMKVK